MPNKMNWVGFSATIARGLLQLKQTRRKLIAATIVAVLAVFALGNWPLAEWLSDHPLLFILYWSGCTFLAFFLFLLGLYDFLCIMKEYRDARDRL